MTNQQKISPVVLLVVAFSLSGSLFVSPKHASAALTFPPDLPCDAQNRNPAGYHLAASEVVEDGTIAFRYGLDNNTFVTTSGDVVTFHIAVTLPPDTTGAIMRFGGFSVACALGFGSTIDVIPNSINTVDFNRATYQFRYNGGSWSNVVSSTGGLPVYFFIEVLDSYPSPAISSYSYTVDVWNPLNPGGTPPPRRLNPDPVVIIPGILGSEEKNGIWTLDPILHAYDDLVDTFEANGYKEGYDLFLFPYDWKQSNVVSAQDLQMKIGKAKIACQCDKVDLVAHSMGGIVARQYIESNNYQNDIDQLIFLGTPHLGSPEAYLGWEGGELYPNILGTIEKFILEKDAFHQGYFNLYYYIRNKPVASVRELLPIVDYLRDANSGQILPYPTGYPRNAFLERLNANVGLLAERGVRVTNITGELGLGSTLNIIRVKESGPSPLWEHGQPEGFNTNVGDRGLELGNGDSTVPARMSVLTDSINEVIPQSKHLTLPDDAKATIFQLLTGRQPQQLVDRFHLPDIRILMIKVLSPVDIYVAAPDGKRVGKNFQSGGEYNEIDGAFYSGFSGDDEYITIPDPVDGEYRVVTKGTGSGEYTVATGYITDTSMSEQDFTAQTIPGLEAAINLTINASAPEPLAVSPEDIKAPIIAINSPQSRDYVRSEILPINVNMQDDDTGVATSTIQLDGKAVNNNDSVDLFFHPLGNHNLSATAADYVGNATSAVVNFRIIATVDSAISDLERSYALGWITSKSIKNSLINKLKATLKLEKRIDEITIKISGKTKVIKRVERFEKIIDKTLLRLLLVEARLYRHKSLNDQAYNILVEDINWLLSN
ncbi:MAG: hypothetical protein Q8N81_02220 [bacterium]|nr:hypothetical protein [bacterium]